MLCHRTRVADIAADANNTATQYVAVTINHGTILHTEHHPTWAQLFFSELLTEGGLVCIIIRINYKRG